MFSTPLITLNYPILSNYMTFHSKRKKNTMKLSFPKIEDVWLTFGVDTKSAVTLSIQPI